MTIISILMKCSRIWRWVHVTGCSLCSCYGGNGRDRNCSGWWLDGDRGNHIVCEPYQQTIVNTQFGYIHSNTIQYVNEKGGERNTTISPSCLHSLALSSQTHRQCQAISDDLWNVGKSIDSFASLQCPTQNQSLLNTPKFSLPPKV